MLMRYPRRETSFEENGTEGARHHDGGAHEKSVIRRQISLRALTAHHSSLMLTVRRWPLTNAPAESKTPSVILCSEVRLLAPIKASLPERLTGVSINSSGSSRVRFCCWEATAERYGDPIDILRRHFRRQIVFKLTTLMGKVIQERTYKLKSLYNWPRCIDTRDIQSRGHFEAVAQNSVFCSIPPKALQQIHRNEKFRL